MRRQELVTATKRKNKGVEGCTFDTQGSAFLLTTMLSRKEQHLLRVYTAFHAPRDIFRGARETAEGRHSLSPTFFCPA